MSSTTAHKQIHTILKKIIKDYNIFQYVIVEFNDKYVFYIGINDPSPNNKNPHYLYTIIDKKTEEQLNKLPDIKITSIRMFVSYISTNNKIITSDISNDSKFKSLMTFMIQFIKQNVV